uniref:Uncharacterized protein n=1 Tax=Sphaerodactylus townsendi TaxID=933632 RepID=A0ACB8GD60_9SAUR
MLDLGRMESDTELEFDVEMEECSSFMSDESSDRVADTSPDEWVSESAKISPLEELQLYAEQMIWMVKELGADISTMMHKPKGNIMQHLYNEEGEKYLETYKLAMVSMGTTLRAY